MGLPTSTSRNLTTNMHYDFKQKLNKVDSQQFRNLRVPEIDWKLNEAEGIMVEMITNPNKFNNLGLEGFQKNIDDIRTIIVKGIGLAVTQDGNSSIYRATLPLDYGTYLSAYVNLSKGNCKVKVRLNIVQYDDETEESPFDKSSFEWREVNAKYHNKQLVITTDGTFSVTSMELDYVRIPKYFHTAVSAVGGTYNLPDGTTLTGYQNCELPEILHREIVDLAVLITTGDLLANYQVKQAKLQLTN